MTVKNLTTAFLFLLERNGYRRYQGLSKRTQP